MEQVNPIIDYRPSRLIIAATDARNAQWEALEAQHEKTRDELLKEEIEPSIVIPKPYELELVTVSGEKFIEVLTSSEYVMLGDFVSKHRDNFYYDSGLRMIRFGGGNWDDAPTKSPVIENGEVVKVPIHSVRYFYSFKTNNFFIEMKPVAGDPYIDKFTNPSEFDTNYRVISANPDRITYNINPPKVQMGDLS